MNRDSSFTISGVGATLLLENLYAKVRISAGSPGTATVFIKGGEKVINQFTVSQPSPDQVVVRGEQVVSDGISISSVGRGSSVSIGGNIRGSTVISGRGSVVIVNGKVISGGDRVTIIEGDEMPEITIKVPEGTDLKAYGVETLSSLGLNGRATLSLSGQDKATICDVRGMKVKCSGQSQCGIEKASGNLNVTTSGQSGLTVVGDIGDVEADSSGQSHILIGNCKNFDGESSGQSSISVLGRVTGKVRKHSSGQSSILAN